METQKKWNTKCKFFNEKYACDTLTNEEYKSCNECKFSYNYSKKILIISFGALGTVVRTTPILEGIKKKYGNDTMIYWLTKEGSKEILEGNPYIDKVLVYNLESALRLQQERFDILFSLEIEPPVTLIANLVNADEKFGFYFDNGATSCFNRGAEEYLETAFLTHIKLENRKSYQDLIFKVCEMKFDKENPMIELGEEYIEYAKEYLRSQGLKADDKLLGINFGSAGRWPSKAWSKTQIRELIKKITEYKVILLGGPEEIEKIKEMKEEFNKEGIEVYSNDPNNSIKEFSGILSKCEKLVLTDSLALHIATALKKPIVALFFSTPEWEIEDYGRIKKIQSPLFKAYFFSNNYSEKLANSITADEVLKKL